MEASPTCSTLINCSTKGPCISSQETTLKDHHHDAEEEESGWTTYLEDFSRYRSLTSGLEHHSSFTSPSLSLGSSSLVSDAASRYHDLPIPPLNGLGYNQETSMKKLSLIKNNRRPKKIKEREDPLEDTASSPVSIPTLGLMQDMHNLMHQFL